MGRSRYKPGLDLRTQAARITHLIDPARLDDISEEIGRTPVFRILTVEIASALLELPTQFDQHTIPDTRLGTRTIKPCPHLGRKPPDRLLQRPIKNLVARLRLLGLHILILSVYS